MTEGEFISDMKSAISAACALPVTIREKEIKRIIGLAAKWFYRNYEDAVEERYYVIPKTTFETETFTAKRTVTMPNCVVSVSNVKKLREDFGRSMTWDGTADLSVERLILQNSETNVGTGTDNLMYYVMNLSWLTTTSQILNHPVSFNYNRNSRKLFFAGEKPDKDVVVTTWIELPLESLYEDELFFRYVEARCKIQISNVLGTFDFNYPGNIKVNYSEIRSEGQEMYQEIRDEIKENNSNDFFFTSGGI